MILLVPIHFQTFGLFKMTRPLFKDFLRVYVLVEKGNKYMVNIAKNPNSDE